MFFFEQFQMLKVGLLLRKQYKKLTWYLHLERRIRKALWGDAAGTNRISGRIILNQENFESPKVVSWWSLEIKILI